VGDWAIFFGVGLFSVLLEFFFVWVCEIVFIGLGLGLGLGFKSLVCFISDKFLGAFPVSFCFESSFIFVF
jgi:hypothetical protein